VSNAISFRLGYSHKWVNSWVEENLLYKQYLQEDFIIVRFIKLFFFYSIPYRYLPQSKIGKKRHKKIIKYQVDKFTVKPIY